MDAATRYRLDNVGTFYAAQAGSPVQTVFRFSAAMADAVDAAALQAALDDTVALFPSFNVCLRSGLFWHYLEPAAKAPSAQPEVLPICFGLHTGHRSTLFRVSWHEQRINLEVSHMISDGRGSLEFFRTLVGLYAQHRYGAPYEGALGQAAAEARSQQAEDSFSRHYDRRSAAATRSTRAWRLPGLRDQARPTFMEYHLPAGRVHQWARSMGVSVTSLIIAAVICAVRAEMPARDRNRPIRLDVPVDLRQFFDSSTMRNFFGLAFVSYTPDPHDEPLDAVAAQVQQQILAGCTADAMKGRMNRMVALEKNPVLRMAPLFVKDLALAVGARIAARDVTTTVSSLGRVELPASAAPFVRSVSVLTSTTGLNFVACTFGDDLSLGISTVFRNLAVVRSLCRIFAGQGIEGRIDINQDARQVSHRLHEMRLADTLHQMSTVRKGRGGHAHLR